MVGAPSHSEVERKIAQPGMCRDYDCQRWQPERAARRVKVICQI